MRRGFTHRPGAATAGGCAEHLHLTQHFRFAEHPLLYRLVGFISDASGAPIQGARVEALDSDGNRVSHCDSDENGNYALEGLPSGDTYTVVVNKDGYFPWLGIFNVFRDRLWNIVLQR